MNLSPRHLRELSHMPRKKPMAWNLQKESTKQTQHFPSLRSRTWHTPIKRTAFSTKPPPPMVHFFSFLSFDIPSFLLSSSFSPSPHCTNFTIFLLSSSFSNPPFSFFAPPYVHFSQGVLNFLYNILRLLAIFLDFYQVTPVTIENIKNLWVSFVAPYRIEKIKVNCTTFQIK